MPYNLANTLSRINILKERERITKEEIKELSRDTLMMLHDTENNPHCGDISAVNALLHAVTPANQKILWIYMKHFTGFSPVLDENGEEHAMLFAGKARKAQYERACEEAMEFVSQGGNLWIWAEKNVEIKKTPYTLGKFQEQLASAFKKAEKNNISKADQLAAILANGITLDDLMDTMEAMQEADNLLKGGEHTPKEDEQEQASIEPQTIAQAA